MYDQLSSVYDRFVNWPSRLAFETPFLLEQLKALGALEKPLKILDAACGTGMHAIELARRGARAAGADLSEKMISRARLNAAQARVMVDFRPAGFGALQAAFTDVLPMDALLCLGNSLPHVLTRQELHATLADFAACLRPGGLLLIQNRNFDAVLRHRERWMEPQAYSEGDAEWIFLRFYDFEADGTITFNLLTLRRTGMEPWVQQVGATRLYPWRRDELETALLETGFTSLAAFGGMDGSPFEASTSGNLVLVVRRG
jgi:glycine/sarcosine N-methyltransferase